MIGDGSALPKLYRLFGEPCPVASALKKQAANLACGQAMLGSEQLDFQWRGFGGLTPPLKSVLQVEISPHDSNQPVLPRGSSDPAAAPP
jgi:hypothetical protein